MIFKKPYAFLIKNFKLIHIILCVVIIYITNKFNSLVTFFGDLSRNSVKVVEGTAGQYITLLFVLAVLITLVFSTLMAILMKKKKKPNTFYIITDVYYSIILILLVVASSRIRSLYGAGTTLQVTRALRDIYLIMSFPNYYFIIMSLIRGIGFDIKKFNFRKDLEDLEISTNDNEEFEFVLGKDTYKYTRKARRFFREIKYYVLEHKFIFTILGGILGITFLIIIVLNINFGNPTHRMGKTATAKGLQITVNNAYETAYDYNGNIVDKSYKYIIVDLSLQSIYNEKNLNRDEVYLSYGSKKVYFKNTLKDYFIDFGKAYNGAAISTKQAERSILIFELPAKENATSYKLNFLNQATADEENIYTYEYTKFKIKPQKIDKNIIEENKNFNETIYLGELNYNKTSLLIKDAEIVPYYEYKYELCENNECKEYISVEKVENGAMQKLMVINYNINLDNTIPILNSFNSNKETSLFNKILKIRYNYNDKSYIYSGTTKINSNIKDTLFLTIDNKVASSTEKELLINTRQGKYFINLS